MGVNKNTYFWLDLHHIIIFKAACYTTAAYSDECHVCHLVVARKITFYIYFRQPTAASY